MNPQIYSDRVDLTSETYFIQIPARSENLRILLWQREVVNIKILKNDFSQIKTLQELQTLSNITLYCWVTEITGLQ